MKNIILIFSLILMFSCNGQEKNGNKTIKTPQLENNNKMREKFDFNEYKNRESAVHIITRNDSIFEMVYNEKRGGHYNITLPKPSFETIYKEFNKDGDITKEEHYIGEKLKVGVSIYYDDVGNVREVNENEKFGKIKPIDALRFLEKKDLINLKTGEGRKTKDGWPSFELSYEKVEGRNQFIIIIKEGKPDTGPWDDIGEPPAFLPVTYIMDGETGKVEEIE